MATINSVTGLMDATTSGRDPSMSSGTPDNSKYNERYPTAESMRYDAEHAAAEMIQRCWRRYRDRALFRYRKAALLQAEAAMAIEVLKELCPLEAALLTDPTMVPLLRFRFDGIVFPPKVVYKVSLTDGKSSIIYMSGKKIIKPASTAAADAYARMGYRKFVDQMKQDVLQHQQLGMTDELDVTTMKEYMHFASTTDSMDAALGGRGNSWRGLQVLWDKISMMCDIYQCSGKASILRGVVLP